MGKKRFTCTLLIVSMLVTLLAGIKMPETEVLAAAEETLKVNEEIVTQRIKELARHFGINDGNLSEGIGRSYTAYSDGNKTCSETSADSKNAKVLTSAWFKEEFGFKGNENILPRLYIGENIPGDYKGVGGSYGFANFVGWYVARRDLNSDMYRKQLTDSNGIGFKTFSVNNLKSVGVRIGDIVYLTNGSKSHTFVFIKYINDEAILIMDCDENCVTAIRKYTFYSKSGDSFAGRYDGYKMAVTRMKNYEPDKYDLPIVNETEVTKRIWEIIEMAGLKDQVNSDLTPKNTWAIGKQYKGSSDINNQYQTRIAAETFGFSPNGLKNNYFPNQYYTTIDRYSSPVGTTCFAFAGFVGWYIGRDGTKDTTVSGGLKSNYSDVYSFFLGSAKFNAETVKNLGLRTGDVLRFSEDKNADPGDEHSAIFLKLCEDGTIIVLDSNRFNANTNLGKREKETNTIALYKVGGKDGDDYLLNKTYYATRIQNYCPDYTTSDGILKEKPDTKNSIASQIGQGLMDYAVDLSRVFIEELAPTEIVGFVNDILSYKECIETLTDPEIISKLGNSENAEKLIKIINEANGSEIPDEQLEVVAKLYSELLKENPDIRSTIISIVMEKAPELAIYLIENFIGKSYVLVFKVFMVSAERYAALGNAVGEYQNVTGEHSDFITNNYNRFIALHYEDLDLIGRAAVKDGMSGSNDLLYSVRNVQETTEVQKQIFIESIDNTLTAWFSLTHPNRAKVLKQIREELTSLNTDYEQYYWDVFAASKPLLDEKRSRTAEWAISNCEGDYGKCAAFVIHSLRNGYNVPDEKILVGQYGLVNNIETTLSNAGFQFTKLTDTKNVNGILSCEGAVPGDVIIWKDTHAALVTEVTSDGLIKKTQRNETRKNVFAAFTDSTLYNITPYILHITGYSEQ